MFGLNNALRDLVIKHISSLKWLNLLKCNDFQLLKMTKNLFLY